MNSFFAKRRDEIPIVTYAETTFVKFVAKNNEPFSIYYNGFSKIGNDISPDSELAKKYGTGKTKTTEIIKGESLFVSEETKRAQCVIENIF